jgi:hypothetical protein
MSAGDAPVYVYAITRTGAVQTEGVLGLDDAPVTLIEDGELSAAVSTAPRGRIRPQRKHIAAHQRVLTALNEQATVLPMSFGTVADDADAAMELLETCAEDFQEQLETVAGRLEMSLRLVWDTQNVVDFFVARNEELEQMRKQIAERAAEYTREDMIAVGERFAKVLEAEREALVERVQAGIACAAVDVVVNPPRDDREAVNLACLIERDGEEAFERALQHLAEGFGEEFIFDYSGPWPPHHFARLDVQTPASGQNQAA